MLACSLRRWGNAKRTRKCAVVGWGLCWIAQNEDGKVGGMGVMGRRAGRVVLAERVLREWLMRWKRGG